MMLQADQIDKEFPELNGIAPEQKKEIVEVARYQTYKQLGGRQKLVWPYLGLWLLMITIGMGLFIFLAGYFELKGGYFSGILAGAAGGIPTVTSFYLYQQALIKHMRPKVLELAERYRSDD